MHKALLLLLTAPWQTLAPGVEYSTFQMPVRAKVGPSVLHAVRVDPARARVDVLAASQRSGGNRTAQRWCEDFKAVVAINAGMYANDHRTHTGFMKLKEHINSDRWLSAYQSVLLLQGPKAEGAARIADRDAPGLSGLMERFGVIIQNIRIIKHPAQIVWARQKQRWSEAAIAQDKDGRLLFVFSRSPYPVRSFAEQLLQLPLGISAMMHAEGGPEASLSIHTETLKLDLSGSYETGFNENDDNKRQWRVPNVVAVWSKAQAEQVDLK